MTTKNPSPKIALAHLRALVPHVVRLTRSTLRKRKTRCSPRCKGWFIDGESGLPTRCDECAVSNGYEGVIHDGVIALLPEAYKAFRSGNVDGVLVREPDVVRWIATEAGAARTDDVEELSASDAVRLGAQCLKVNPAWLAHEVSKKLRRISRRRK